MAISLGVYGNVHGPTGQLIYDFGFSSVLAMKAWFATGAAMLAVGQATSAAALYGRLPFVKEAPSWLGGAHRWLGTVAFLFTLPIAYHCLWSLGFQSTNTRVVVHSVLGCAFYGAFTTKMLVLHSRRMPSWALPLMGALLVTVLVALWTTSSLWYFRTFGFPNF